MVNEYNEESLICSGCTNDRGLKRKIEEVGTKTQCSVCGKNTEFAITFETLTEWIEHLWREWFHVGDSVPSFTNMSDKVEYVQSGDDPELLIGEMIQCIVDEENIISSLITLMSRGDCYEVMQGGEPLIDDCQLYQAVEITESEVNNRWNSFVLGLKHHTRFFNDRAIEFLNRLFEDLNEVQLTKVSFLLDNDHIQSVISEYDPGTLVLFRARKVSSRSDYSKIVDSPQLELKNPPDSLATEGRMNPEGISYFYASEDRETCVAELRPSISEKIISGEFELVETVKLLDLTLLSQGIHQSNLSMFDDDYLEKQIHRQLLRKLHFLIAQPVLDGSEFDYLPTQAMAEYLARRTKPRIDGIIFESVQRKNGRNIVLFPHVLDNENHSALDFINTDSVVKFKPNTLMLHRIRQIDYNSDDREITNDKQHEYYNHEYEYL